jgi:hypothetical protein
MLDGDGNDAAVLSKRLPWPWCRLQVGVTDVSKVTSAVLSMTVADVLTSNVLTVLGLPYTSWGEHSVTW